MPGRKAFLIASEYLRAEEPAQVRKNAMTALAALDDPGSREILATQAIAETDPDVRQRAQSEIANMPPEWSEQVLAIVTKNLEVPERQQTAYALLGELRNRGLSFPLPSMSLRRRLRLAKGMRDYLYPHRGFKFVFRSFAGALFGTFVAWIALLALGLGLGFHVDWEGDLLVLFLGCLLSTLVAAASTFFSSPAGFFADWWGGALLDMIAAAVTAFVASVIVVLFTVTRSAQQSAAQPLEPKTHPFYLLLFAPLVGAAIKAGTTATFGVAKGKWLNRIVQTFAGGLCAVAVLELVLITSGKTADDVLANSWLWIVLSSYGLAAAFSWIDSHAERRAVVPPVGRMAALLATLLCVIFNLCQLIPFPVQKFDLGSVTPPKAISLEIHQVPQSISFTLASNCQISATTVPESIGVTSLVRLPATSVGSSGPQIVQSGYSLDPAYPALNPNLDSGSKYQVDISRDENHTDLVSIIPQMVKQMSWSHFTARLFRHEPTGMAPLLKVEINFHK